jgi:aspartate kinase
VKDLQAFADVTVIENQSIVCVVGEQMRSTMGVVDRVFRAVSNINVMMISQGASEINMSLVVDETVVAQAVQQLHREFFEPVPELDLFEQVDA